MCFLGNDNLFVFFNKLINFIVWLLEPKENLRQFLIVAGKPFPFILTKNLFDFRNKNTPCLKCFYQSEPSDEILNCEAEGIMGPVAGIIGNIQANEVLKKILKIGKDLNKCILIINLLTLNFRKVSFNKKKNCQCENY